MDNYGTEGREFESLRARDETAPQARGSREAGSPAGKCVPELCDVPAVSSHGLSAGS
jgi:hypothetical protein